MHSFFVNHKYFPDNILIPKDESKLWIAFQEGDPQAYTEIYHRYIRDMYRYGSSLVTTSESFVLDCIQDVFTELWSKRERLSIPVNVKYYLLKALKTRIIHLLERKEKAYRPLADIDLELFELNETEIAEELETARDQQEKLEIFIRQLPNRQQEALKLRFVENLNYEQIGGMLQVNTQSAKNLVFRAIEKLRRMVL
ncbi:RNA polymerase sigma factor (sigma-70 family) [Dyadobacter jejuensis]|uniref:RNA polymerase sigma factor (Sigma-70 family) n=1 Tax=Dyadobacter jejuensis TaxID=1082580 RepID=A0A316AJR1_9BACT|nr:RNA polymerase sigma factor (sigma-70 family) [Dyadobacter jejuensis]